MLIIGFLEHKEFQGEFLACRKVRHVQTSVSKFFLMCDHDKEYTKELVIFCLILHISVSKLARILFPLRFLPLVS